jgi:hypothetical protein
MIVAGVFPNSLWRKTMRSFSSLAVFGAVVLFALAGMADAKGKTKGMSGTYQGTIVSIAGHNVTIQVANDSHRILVVVDKGTKIADSAGKTGTPGDLAAGQIVNITVASSHAKTITVTGVVSNN